MDEKMVVLNIMYNGSIMIQNGDIIEILRGIRTDGDGIRATKIRNVTQGEWEMRSAENGIFLALKQEDFDPPYKGRVRSITFPGSGKMCFKLILGEFVEEHIFVPAGNQQMATDILSRILLTELVDYVKICDPYIGERTFELLRAVPNCVQMFILFEKPGGDLNDDDIPRLFKELVTSGRTAKIRRCRGKLHARFILTSGGGWTVGHSLKDAGEKDTNIDKMKDSRDVEETFDQHWNCDSQEL